MTKHKPAGGAVVLTELPIAALDQSPAAAVRAELNLEAVAAYAEIENMPPVDVFEGEGQYFLGDGRHRIAARLRGNCTKIACSVTRCGHAEAALALARVHAFGANATHGLPRTAQDKRAAVRACLVLPEYADASDRQVAELCKVGHNLVSKVREEMTRAAKLSGAAASTNPARRSCSPVPRSKPITDVPAGCGGAGVFLDRQSGRAATTDPDDVPPAAEVLDARGRAIPEPLVADFQAGRALVADLRRTLAEVLDALTLTSAEEWARGIAPLLPALALDLKNVARDVAGAVPWCCCPHIGADGLHLDLGGKCRVCVNGRGWLSRHNWHQLTDSVKALIDQMGDAAAVEAA